MNAAPLVLWIKHYTVGLVASGYIAGAPPPFVSVSKIDDAFWPALVTDARAWGVDPRDLAAVMFAESGLNPRAVNPDPEGGAVGINQLFRSNWKKFLFDRGMSVEEYSALPASEQWKRVAGPFFRGVIESHPDVRGAAPENRARDLYWLNYKPATYVPNAPEDHPIGKDSANSALQLPGDPIVRPAGLRAFLEKQQRQGGPRWAGILAAIDAVEGGGGPVPLPPGVAQNRPVPRRVPAGVESEGISLGTILAVSAMAGAGWFVWSSYHAAGRLKAAVIEHVAT